MYRHIEGIRFPQLTGSDGEDDDDDDDDQSNRINGGSDSNDDDDDDDEGDDDDLTDEQKNARKLARENRKRRKDNAALKARLAELEKEQEEAKLSRKTKLEQEQAKREEATRKAQTLSSTNERLLLENAILKDSKRDWHDPSAVIALLNRDDIEVDPESGNIEGIEEALSDLAKDKPFLVKTAGTRQNNGASGGHPSGGRNGDRKTKEQEQAELKKKWKLG